jgi:hypothetical protein
VAGGATIWSESRNQTKTVIVKEGAQLRIQGTSTMPVTINMGYLRQIIVEKGGSLVVEHAKLTNECGNLWTGISVVGDELIGQCSMPTNMNYNAAKCLFQGVVWLNHAIIENAMIGIKNGSTYYNVNDEWPQWSGHGGGIIIAENQCLRIIERQ